MRIVIYYTKKYQVIGHFLITKINVQIREQQLTAAAQAAAAQASQPQDLGLARLGALGALADLADGAVGGGDLLNEVPSTINYEDLVIGNQAAAHAGI